jgi:hypothetical protein
MRKKPRFPTCRITNGDDVYYVDLKVLPGRPASRTGPDSPRYLDPGRPTLVSVIRIRRNGIELGRNDLFYWTRRSIEEAAIRLVAKGGGSCSGAVETVAAPSFHNEGEGDGEPVGSFLGGASGD